MFLIVTRRQLIWMFGLTLLFLLGYMSQFFWFDSSAQKVTLAENEIYSLVNSMFHLRNQAILEENATALQWYYDRTTRTGVWAYEHQAKKMKYLHNWSYKQGVKLSAIKSLVQLRRVQAGDDRIQVTLLVSTEYCYNYLNQPEITNFMRIGTYHSLQLVYKAEQWLIRREWYTDPFADALEIGIDQKNSVQKIILAKQARDFFNISPRRLQAVAYADAYCGAAANSEVGFRYNSKYKNYNYSGGDCANFASQVLHEGGGFSKTASWNYGKDGSKAWANAHAFNQFMLSSGRASRIAVGTYSQVLGDSYKLLPGDYIAYEKKGRVTHISVITGADSRGYALTNSHNADRYRVPWDLGYGNRGVRFWLMRVNY